jgi:signal transduction histidine kinase
MRDVTTARQARAQRDAFLGILSHELRTPITTIYAGSSVLAREGSLTPTASHDLAADISAEAARLYDLVEDLLVVARSERRVLEPIREPILLQRVLDGALRVAASRAPHVPVIRAGATDPAPVVGDMTYVEHAVRNLLMSAVRYGGPGAPVIVRLDEDAERGEIRLRVFDRGPDLSPQELQRAFELVEDRPVSRRPGMALAAFVARRLVEAMGGRTWATARPDGGAEFGLALLRDVG